MNLTNIIKYAIKYPQQIPKYAVQIIKSKLKSKEHLSADFFKNKYREYKPQFVFSKLEQYWRQFRYYEDLEQIISSEVGELEKKKILDVGCGYTSVLNILTAGERYGTDIVINQLQQTGLELNKEITWITAPTENLPFDENYFDLVFCTNGLDHYDRPVKSLKEIKRVLKPKGLLILTVDTFPTDLGYRNKKHPHTYTEKKIISQLKDYEIIFKKKSPIHAQFYKFINSGIKKREENKEIIIAAKLKSGQLK